MLAFEITDVRDFTGKLFLRETFDGFLLSEASFTTFVSFSINGNRKTSYYDTDEQKALAPDSGKAFWKELRPFCFSIIRGKRLPLHFQIVLQNPPEGIPSFPESALSKENQYFLNIQYRDSRLYGTAGVSLGSFLPGMDRQPQKAWEEFLIRFFTVNQISFRILL